MDNKYMITIIKDVYQFSQTIARQKNKNKKDNYNCKPQWKHN